LLTTYGEVGDSKPAQDVLAIPQRRTQRAIMEEGDDEEVKSVAGFRIRLSVCDDVAQRP
jgi:hypothetical protein